MKNIPLSNFVRNKRRCTEPKIYLYHSYTHTHTLFMKRKIFLSVNKFSFRSSWRIYTATAEEVVAVLKWRSWIGGGGGGAVVGARRITSKFEGGGKVLCDDNKAFILNAHACEHILHIITFRNMSRTHLNGRNWGRERKSDLAFQFHSNRQDEFEDGNAFMTISLSLSLVFILKGISKNLTKCCCLNVKVFLHITYKFFLFLFFLYSMSTLETLKVNIYWR